MAGQAEQEDGLLTNAGAAVFSVVECRAIRRPSSAHADDHWRQNEEDS